MSSWPPRNFPLTKLTERYVVLCQDEFGFMLNSVPMVHDIQVVHLNVIRCFFYYTGTQHPTLTSKAPAFGTSLDAGWKNRIEIRVRFNATRLLVGPCLDITGVVKSSKYRMPFLVYAVSRPTFSMSPRISLSMPDTDDEPCRVDEFDSHKS